MIVLWLRSYWLLDYRIVGNSHSCIFVHSQQGQLRGVALLSVPSTSIAAAVQSEESASSELFRTTFALPNSPHRIPEQWTTELADLREFGWTGYADGFKFVAPHWFLAVLCGCLAAAPWARRFDLRMVFLGMTLVAVLFGIAIRSD
jgi:hypothetical protein